jgi:imidazolonepropionase-like amidohydrolase
MRTLIADVRLIDGVAAAAREHVDVLVDGDRITAIEPHGRGRPDGDPADADGRPAARIDGAGRTLLPGLIDAHTHYTFDPTEGSIGVIARRSDAEIVLAAAGSAARALRAGVTTARGAGSIRNLEVALRDAIAAGIVPGPRLIAAGTAVGITGGHGYQFGLEADGPAAFVTATRRVVRDGADVVKVVASEAAMLTTTGLAGSRMVHGAPELTLDELRAVVETATELGVKVMSHAQDAESVRRSAQSGVASVEHAWLADRPAIEALAASGAFLVPTLVVTDVNRTLGGLTPVQRERQDLIERRQRASTETAIELGVPLATGTDTGEVGVTADMVWREIALIHAHGATPMAAIQAATSGAARLLGIDTDLGTVEAGKLADLVLVEGDPLTDLARLASPSLVIQAGVVVAHG